ncbi:acyl carrier protein [Peptostreptococcus faecalis]|uniref:acyl carrier protein n=1 Tax=Peptostreptococcus faecalis TaxID=2045015 RepID=UPI000C7C7461|nr:acyl carrier protein [Peptostreptococcus faecalis]
MFERIKEIIVEQLNVDDDNFIDLDTDLQEDLDADSLDAVEIIMNIEEEFDIKIPDEDINDIKTIGDIIKYIEDEKK